MKVRTWFVIFDVLTVAMMLVCASATGLALVLWVSVYRYGDVWVPPAAVFSLVAIVACGSWLLFRRERDECARRML